MKRLSLVLLVCLCLGGVAVADVTTPIVYNSGNLPSPGASAFVVAAAAPNFTITLPTAPPPGPPAGFVLVPSGTIGTGSFKATLRFATPVTITTGQIGTDFITGGGPGPGTAAATVGASTVDLVSPIPTAFGSVARPTTAFGVQIERTPVGPTQSTFTMRVDLNNNGSFLDPGETVGPTGSAAPIARSLGWLSSTAGTITLSEIRIEPGVQVAPQATPSASAPTMGSWGAIVMALVLLVIAGMAIRAKKVSA